MFWSRSVQRYKIGRTTTITTIAAATTTTTYYYDDDDYYYYYHYYYFYYYYYEHCMFFACPLGLVNRYHDAGVLFCLREGLSLLGGQCETRSVFRSRGGAVLGVLWSTPVDGLSPTSLAAVRTVAA